MSRSSRLARVVLLAFAVLALFVPAVPAATGGEAAVPRPHGWIGTAEDWARGLGIAFAVLDLAILLSLWTRVRTSGLTPASLFFFGVAILPLAIVFFAYYYGLETSKSVQACGSCHTMIPYVRDLRDPKSETLAAVHYKNRYIQQNHCYTCHTDYGMFGTVKAKWEGLGHTVRYATDAYSLPLQIAHPYPNWRCLNCHGASQKFLAPEKHPKEDMADLVSGKTSCLDCHGPPHPRPDQEASR